MGGCVDPEKQGGERKQPLGEATEKKEVNPETIKAKVDK
jgi:hypothetical protein